MGFHHILVAYDGGQPSIKALDQAIEMAQLNPGAKLTVVNVYSVPAVAVADAVVAVPASVQEVQFHQAQDVLGVAEARIASMPNATSVLLQGSPGESIVSYANKHQVDLIIMGNRGHGAIREFVMGSVSHYVLQHTLLPMLIVK